MHSIIKEEDWDLWVRGDLLTCIPRVSRLWNGRTGIGTTRTGNNVIA
jgi:hypothetical protein